MSETSRHLKRSLSTVEYFTFGFGTMVGVGWLVLMDDWLGRGGPAGAAIAYLIGGIALMPIAVTYGRLAREIPDAGAEIAYAEKVMPPAVSFVAAWTMVLSYAIVCPWEAVAIGNLLARVLPALNRFPLYTVAGRTITAPRLLLGLALTALIGLLNYRGIRQSGRFQNAMTFGLLAIFAGFVLAGLSNAHRANAEPLFARPGASGAALSILLALQIVPYFLTGFESVAKGAEEARPGLDTRSFGRAMVASLASGAGFYVVIIATVSLVFPWKALVDRHLGTEAAFRQAFGSPTIARFIVLAALLSLLKVFNGNFVASTRLLFGIARRGYLPVGLSRVHPVFGTPARTVVFVTALTAAASFLGDAVLVPISEVGSLAVGVGWLSTAAAYLLRRRAASPGPARPAAGAVAAAAVAAAIVAMKLVPGVPGSFTRAEWIALAGWLALGFALRAAAGSRRGGEGRA